MTRGEYDEHWSEGRIEPIRNFVKKFDYVTASTMQRRPTRVLDLGGGTGEYALLLQDVGFDVTLLDFSEVAVEMAAAAGVKTTLVADFMAHDFGTSRYDVVLAKGFSPLNTENGREFEAILQRAQNLLAPGGVVLYWVYSTLEERWSRSGWFEIAPARIAPWFDEVVVLPWFNLQCSLPWWLNQLLSRWLGALTYGRRVAVIGIARSARTP